MSLDQVYLGFPVIGNLIEHGFLPTLVMCLIICPGVPYLLGAVLDGYWVPWHYSVQFFAFLPGNLFLALFIACTSVTFQAEGFQINPIVNVVVLFGAFAAYWFLQNGDKAVYTEGQLRSAMKRYHNLLYFWYGYLAVVCGVVMWSTATPLQDKIWFTIPGLFWLLCMVADAMVDKYFPEIAAQRFKYAHVASKPIWKNGWHIRRLIRTACGFEYV